MIITIMIQKQVVQSQMMRPEVDQEGAIGPGHAWSVYGQFS